MKRLEKKDSKSTIPPMVEWNSVNWQKLENHMFNIQQRIFHAERNKNFKKVRDLQRLILRSQSSLLISIRRVTALNKGKRTAGVDGYKALTEQERINLYMKMKDRKFSLHYPKPAKRTYIEKKKGKLRPLGIPTVIDRVYQNIVKLALEPQWEAKFESISYGFRPKRSQHDAIEKIYATLNKGKKEWIFEGDFRGCFDNLNHDFIMKQLHNFPAKDLVAKWLKSGFIDNNVFHVTESGTPQGGILSPLLANIALHGMEEAIGIEYFVKNKRTGERGIKLKIPYSLVRFADDFVIMANTKEQAENLFNKLTPYLKERGLELENSKTKIVHVTEGFDFLGFNIRQYKVSNKKSGKKLLIKPNKASIQKAKRDIAVIYQMGQGENVANLISKLRPVLRGKAEYWKPFVAKEVFSHIDNYVYWKSRKFLRKLHLRKSWKWIKNRYYKPASFGVNTEPILTDPTNAHYQLNKLSWTPIKHHALITYDYSPFNKELKDYFHDRAIREFDSNNTLTRQKLAKKQKYICPCCGQSILDEKEGLEVHHKIPKYHKGKDTLKNLVLIHIGCHIAWHKAFPARGKIPTDIEVRAWLKSWQRHIRKSRIKDFVELIAMDKLIKSEKIIRQVDYKNGKYGIVRK